MTIREDWHSKYAFSSSKVYFFILFFPKKLSEKTQTQKPWNNEFYMKKKKKD